MGKGALLIVAAGIMAGSMMLYQAQRSSSSTDAVQSEQQEKVLAREIARSAYGAATSRARSLDSEGKSTQEIVAELKSPDDPSTGDYQGGDFEYWGELVSGSTYRIGARGMYGDASYVINASRTMDSLLIAPDFCDEGCTLEALFEQSQAGYCSAIYLNRTLDDVDEEDQPEPELVFASGHDRNDAAAEFESTIQSGTQLNFILAVDQDCKVENEDVPITNPAYSHRRRALDGTRQDFEEMPEGGWAITEMDEDQEGRWRIAFEDRPDEYGSGIRFTEPKRNDIKENGYPDSYNVGDGAWDGTTYDPNRETNDFDYRNDGFIELRDYGNIPDFSDQVFYVKLTPVGGV